MFRRTAVYCVAVLALLATVSCDSSTRPTAADIQRYLTSVRTSDGNITAAFHAGAPPAGGSGPTITLNTSSGFITGGTAIVDLSGSSAFTNLVVAIDGVNGYYELTFGSPVTSAELLLALSTQLPTQNFTIEYAGGAAGAFGNYLAQNVQIVQVGTGVLQVSLSWNTNADMDLHLVEPTGEEIYWGNESSAAGGELDLDSNAACAGDNVRNENITYASSAPAGTYIVRVNHWANCGATSTSWVVTIRNGNNPVQTYTGTVTGSGNGGGLGAGVQVATFNR